MVVTKKKEGWGEEVAQGKGDPTYGDRGDLTWGGGHAMQYTDDVLWNCTLESCNCINQHHPNKFNLKNYI